MAQSLFQDLPQAQGNWQVNMSKMAVLFGQWMQGDLSPSLAPSGMAVPANDEQILEYYGSSNNVSNIIYKQGGQVVATQTFEYVGGGVADDDNISRITLTLP